MRKRSLVRIVAVGAIGALALTACSSSKKSNSGGGGGLGGGSATSSGGGGGAGKTYTIGYQGPLSGDNAQLGINEVNAVELAVDQANSSGSLPFKLQLVKSDDKGDPASAPAAATALIQNQAVVGVIGPAFSGPTKAVGAAYAQAGLTMISPSATNSTLTSSGFSTFFRVVPPDSVQGTQAADYLAKKAKSVFVVDDTSDYGKGLAGDITKELKAKGIKYQEQGVPANTQDYGAISQKVASSGSDAMYYAGYYAGASLFAKALTAAGFKGLKMSGDGSKDAQFIKGAGTADANAWQFTCPCEDATVDPNAKSFADAYQAKWNTPSATYSPEAYDATNAMISVIKDAASKGTVDRAAVLAGVKAVDYKGLTNQIKFQPNGEIQTAKIFVYEVKNGKLALLGTAADLSK